MLGLFIVMASIIDVPYTLLGGHQMLVFIIGMMVCTNYKRIMCGCKILSGGDNYNIPVVVGNLSLWKKHSLASISGFY